MGGSKEVAQTFAFLLVFFYCLAAHTSGLEQNNVITEQQLQMQLQQLTEAKSKQLRGRIFFLCS